MGRNRAVGSAELLALTIERGVLEWVLGDRPTPPIPLGEGAESCLHDPSEEHTD